MSAQFQQYLAEELPLGPPNIRTQTPSHDNPPLSLYPWLEPAAHINPASDGTESQATGWENELRSCQEIGFLLPDIMDLYPSYEDMSIYQCERRPISFDTEHVHPAMLPLQGQEPSFSSDQRQRSQPKDSMTPRNLTRSAAKQESTRRQHRVQKQPIPRLTRRTTKAPHLPRTPCPIPGCEVTVARPTDIRRHLSTRHGGERYACLLCAAERGNTNRVEHLYGTKYNLLE